MDRRGFFIAGAAGGLLAPLAAGAAPARAPARAAIASYVTGLRDHLGGAEPPAAPAALGLRREPGRAFDPLSVAVLGPDGARLGYLPAAQGRVLAPLMDAGPRLRGARRRGPPRPPPGAAPGDRPRGPRLTPRRPGPPGRWTSARSPRRMPFRSARG
jgi:hypothetical protein